MINYMEYLNLPEKITIAIVGSFLIMQIVGEFCELGGKTVPEILKIRKFFKRKRQERETIASIPETLKEFNTFLESVNQHYSDDNIAQRNDWMKHVNDGLDDVKILSKYVEDLYIDNRRNMIIDFASNVVNSDKLFTREQFNRIFKVYKEYEEFIDMHDRTNGEIDVAINIIKEAYEKRTREHSFVEDMQGYED